jgi:hypothetical protein
MRWLIWLCISTSCLAVSSGPLPEIKVGTSQRVLEVHAVPRGLDKGTNQPTFLVGTITDVAAEEDRQPQQTGLSETCTLHVESAFGYMDQVVDIQTAVLKASYEQSPYVPIDENWGKLWHFKKGQKLLVILHLHEGKPSFDLEELMVLNEHTASLPDILRRTALQLQAFTDADLEVLKLASPFLHQQILEHTVPAREAHAYESMQQSQPMKNLAIICALVVLGVVVIWKLHK